MAPYALFGDTSGLPKTKRSTLPYEIEALTPKEMWGAGNGNTSLVCRQTWENSVAWIKDMVGEVKVVGQTGGLILKRHIPEYLRYGDVGGGSDSRIQFCTICDQLEQGVDPSQRTPTTNFSQAGTNWPEVDWCKYRAVWEAMPYAILDYANPILTLPAMADMLSDAGAFAGATELYRYVLRSRRSYSREQPIPAASTAGGFKVIDDATPANRKPIGQVGFRVVSMADVTYKWIRIPVGWPPPVGWVAFDPVNPWPPRFNPAAASPTTLKRTRDTFKGTINHDWFDCAALDGYCWPPGELLFIGYDDSHRYYDAAGDWVMDITMTFKAKEAGWNKFLNAKGEWKEVSLDGTSTGVRPYATSNFDNLFRYS